jgi:hypothetical protein
MIPILAFVIDFATFPGIIVHELGHLLACRICGVPVLKVCYLQFKIPRGYVIYEEVKDFTSGFLISVGPFLVNSLLCILMCWPAFIRVRIFGMGDALSYLLLWLGLSIGMHAFPSNLDARNLWRYACQAAKRFNPFAMVSIPLVGLIFVANALQVVWFSAIYAVAIGIGLPELIFKTANSGWLG